MNGYVVFRLLRQRFFYKFSHEKMSLQDIQMSIFTMLIFLTDVANFILQYTMISWTDLDWDTFFTLLRIECFVIDVTTLAPAWFLLFTHKEVKNLVKKFFGFQKTSVITSSVIPIPLRFVQIL
uniref:Serpentine receptor class gamma n=1 Tax=Panagrolaimus davidi TaxID=227884 RepID=A0A914PZD0_9BILA